MSNEVFDFPYHRCSTKYPSRGRNVKLGGNWSYSIKPNTPIVRTFQLAFSGMKWFSNPDGSLDDTTSPQLNLKVLEDFYLAHEMWDSFLYNHPTLGTIPVKFKAPLSLPAGVVDGNGSVLNINIELEEIAIT